MGDAARTRQGGMEKEDKYGEEEGEEGERVAVVSDRSARRAPRAIAWQAIR